MKIDKEAALGGTAFMRCLRKSSFGAPMVLVAFNPFRFLHLALE
jgi:hypothetical protein